MGDSEEKQQLAVSPQSFIPCVKLFLTIYSFYFLYIYFIYPQSWEMLVTAAKTMKTTYNNMI